MIAYALSVVLGVSGGIVLGSIRGLRDVLNPFVVAAYGMPKILVLPWIVLLLGFGTMPAIVYGTIHGLFPILVMVTGAVRDVDPMLLTVAALVRRASSRRSRTGSARRSSSRRRRSCLSRRSRSSWGSTH